MKLGLSFNIFEGEELLEPCIRLIRDQADYISAVYQSVSYFGDPCSPELINLLNSLVEKGYIDELVPYESETDPSHDPVTGHMEQVKKRNVGLELSRKNGCTHHMPIDVDEFYTPEKFGYMKHIADRDGFDVLYCKHNQYYKDVIYMVVPKEEEYVATIHKINPETQFVYNAPCRVAIDPSRKTNNIENFRLLLRGEVEMHHLSFVRKDLRKKLECSMGYNDFKDKLDAIVDYYNNWKFPQPGMWAGGNMVHLVKIDRLFDIE